MRRVEAANRSVEKPRVFIFLGGPEAGRGGSVSRGNRFLTVAVLNLVAEFSATFDTNLMMQVRPDGLGPSGQPARVGKSSCILSCLADPLSDRSPSARPGRKLYPLVVILGPTASGKSSLALDIARCFSGEIVNFDSVQVYRGFDIGTAKLLPRERGGIPHHLIDVAEPEDVFTAGDYARLGREILGQIRNREKLPVLAGGTGFYLRALLQGLFQGPQRDDALRSRLAAAAANKTPGYLHRLLERLDQASSQKIHANDTPKLIRAIEVCLRARKPMSELWQEGSSPLEGFAVTRVGLDPPREALCERIDTRTEAIFQAGLVEEARALLGRGVSREVRPFGSLGYKQALAHIDGAMALEKAIDDTAKNTRRYAKRQMTWFRRDPDITWFKGFGDERHVKNSAVSFVETRLTVEGSGQFV